VCVPILIYGCCFCVERRAGGGGGGGCVFLSKRPSVIPMKCGLRSEATEVRCSPPPPARLAVGGVRSSTQPLAWRSSPHSEGGCNFLVSRGISRVDAELVLMKLYRHRYSRVHTSVAPVFDTNAAAPRAALLRGISHAAFSAPSSNERLCCP